MSCQCGCGRLLHTVLDGRGLPRPWVPGDRIEQGFDIGSPDEPGFEPVAPKPGLPHLVKIDGKWAVVVGPGGVWHSIARAALEHAKKLNKPGDAHG